MLCGVARQTLLTAMRRPILSRNLCTIFRWSRRYINCRSALDFARNSHRVRRCRKNAQDRPATLSISHRDALLWPIVIVLLAATAIMPPLGISVAVGADASCAYRQLLAASVVIERLSPGCSE